MTLGSDGLLVDRAPPSRIEAQHDTAHMTYEDNASQFGLDPDIVNQRRELLSKALNGSGLDTHEMLEATTIAETLRIQVVGGPPTVCATPARRFTMHGVLSALLRGRRVSGRDLEMIVGNLTFLFLTCRPLLSGFNHVYDVMDSCYTQKRRLWKSVLHELRIARGLLIFARSDLDRPWHYSALMVDASLSDYSVAERQADPSLIRTVGEWD